MQAKPTTTRYAFLDGLRGLAALLVVLHHFALSWDEYRRYFGAAPLAVDFFFCLSGFVIAHAYQERLREGMKFREYFVRRLVRLYPMYLLGMMLGLAGVVALQRAGLTDLHGAEIARAAFLNMFYLPYFGAYTESIFALRVENALFPLNTPAWSLFFELMFANVLYALSVRVRSAPAVLAALAGIALIFATYRYGGMPGWGTANFMGGFPRVTYAFFTGVVIYQLRDRIALLGAARQFLVFGALTLLLVLPRMEGLRDYWLTGAVLGVPILVAASVGSTMASGGAAHRLAEYSGRLSYPLYCVHYPLLMLLAAGEQRPHQFVVAIVLFVATALAVAHVLLVGVDEPLRRWIGAHFSRAA